MADVSGGQMGSAPGSITSAGLGAAEQRSSGPWLVIVGPADYWAAAVIRLGNAV